MNAPKRKLTLSLAAVAVDLLDRTEVSDEEFRVAKQGRDLIRFILEIYGAEQLTVLDIARLDDATFAAAHSIVEGGESSVALRVAAEQLDPDSFGSLLSRLARLVAEPDASIAGEFI